MRRTFPLKAFPAIAAATAALALSVPAQAQVTRVQKNPDSLILDGADVKAGTDLFYLSGQLASPIDPTKTFADVKSIEDLGDTKTQTISTLNRIKEILAGRGYAMSDIIKLTLFVAADPKLGHMDFAGANAGFKEFFKTAENPNTVARSTFQVAALAGPYFLIEIEAIAAKKK
ncbi:Rid family hydrolase [Novosphingobium cyanobacteriorum]|jgi:enamine deaminase RidA (YjgF/YER057c/UK114 family)|uniref:Rid family hydrolase n=1 Tax=Novosphingobium cyanobacteriorum TaxID=3024215 RepID=A0ABT6CEU3_9SPHN|nr:Rid family hydrolase [Novosphingobium cyanobacteriorum]MDF8332426.1 Rid family hydrolase [Novosphingobium cyanobacteriorum]